MTDNCDSKIIENHHDDLKHDIRNTFTFRDMKVLISLGILSKKYYINIVNDLYKLTFTKEEQLFKTDKLVYNMNIYDLTWFELRKIFIENISNIDSENENYTDEQLLDIIKELLREICHECKKNLIEEPFNLCIRCIVKEIEARKNTDDTKK
jgi:hypothetical protein